MEREKINKEEVNEGEMCFEEIKEVVLIEVARRERVVWYFVVGGELRFVVGKERFLEYWELTYLVGG